MNLKPNKSIHASNMQLGIRQTTQQIQRKQQEEIIEEDDNIFFVISFTKK